MTNDLKQQKGSKVKQNVRQDWRKLTLSQNIYNIFQSLKLKLTSQIKRQQKRQTSSLDPILKTLKRKNNSQWLLSSSKNQLNQTTESSHSYETNYNLYQNITILNLYSPY
ncbi:hypothetical protein ABPG74_019698 [Tetrahymena malaccensis]